MTHPQCQKRHPSKTNSKTSSNNSPENPGESLPEVVKECAARIHDNHPRMRRDVGSAKVEKLLIAIIRRKKLSGEKAIAFARDLADRHERWCGSEQWAKDDGQFAKGLENWLAPTMERYDAEPNDQQGNRASQSQDEPRGLKVGEIE